LEDRRDINLPGDGLSAHVRSPYCLFVLCDAIGEGEGSTVADDDESKGRPLEVFEGVRERTSASNPVKSRACLRKQRGKERRNGRKVMSLVS